MSKKRTKKSELFSMEIGDKFEFFYKTFTIKNIFDYQWEDSKSVEYEVEYSGMKKFFGVEDDWMLVVTYTEEINIDAIPGNIPQIIGSGNKIPKEIEYKGETFYLDDESAGICTNRVTGEKDEVLCWDYFTNNEAKVLSIEQWDEGEFTASYGHSIRESDIRIISSGDMTNRFL